MLIQTDGYNARLSLSHILPAHYAQSTLPRFFEIACASVSDPLRHQKEHGRRWHLLECVAWEGDVALDGEEQRQVKILLEGKWGTWEQMIRSEKGVALWRCWRKAWSSCFVGRGDEKRCWWVEEGALETRVEHGLCRSGPAPPRRLLTLRWAVTG